jgi:hypothetical protein
LESHSLKYFPSLKKFIEEHHEPVKDITHEWIASRVDYVKLSIEALASLPVAKDLFGEILRFVPDNQLTIDELMKLPTSCDFPQDSMWHHLIYPFLDGSIIISSIFKADFHFFGEDFRLIMRADIEVEFTCLNNELTFNRISELYPSGIVERLTKFRTVYNYHENNGFTPQP